MFPELGPGAMVPCVAIGYGRSRPFLWRFFHENSVDEVVLVLAAKGGALHPGVLRVGSRHHRVEVALPDPYDPAQYVVSVIVQRQSTSEAQRERFSLRCRTCDHEIFSETIEFTPPTTAPLPGFDTILLAARSVELYNESEEQRRCPACGTLNDRFDLDHWGWDRYRQRLEVANAAAVDLANAGGE
jgi:hypothetical protein